MFQKFYDASVAMYRKLIFSHYKSVENAVIDF